MRNTIAIFAMGAALTGASAWAQGSNPAFADPATPAIETGRPERETLNAADHAFLRAAAIGNRAEADLGELAADKASALAVKDFARRMTADHGKSLESVQDLARETETPLPRELDLDHRVVMQQLQEVAPDLFDVEYIRSQVAGHQRTAKLLEYEIGAGQSDRVRAFAKETLPHVIQHLAAAKQIHAELTGAAP